MRIWETVDDVAGWWWESLTIAFNVVMLAGAVIVGAALLEATGALRVAGVVIGLVLVLVGIRLQVANWRESYPRGTRAEGRSGYGGRDQERFF